MSLWARILTGMITRGTASRAAIDGALARGVITDTEHTDLAAALADAESEPGGDLAP